MKMFVVLVVLLSVTAMADTRVLAIRQEGSAMGANISVSEAANGSLDDLIISPHLAPIARSVIPFEALSRARTYVFRGPNNEVLGDITGGQDMTVTTGGGLIISFRLCGGGKQTTTLVLRQNSNNQWVVTKGGDVVRTARVSAQVTQGCTTRVSYE